VLLVLLEGLPVLLDRLLVLLLLLLVLLDGLPVQLVQFS
jgi:hypothetical protein